MAGGLIDGRRKDVVEDVLRQAVDRIVGDFDPVRIILFGSHARGTAGRYSDIDLLVVLDRIKERMQSAIDIRHALSDLPIAKDVIAITSETLEKHGNDKGYVYYYALKEGRVLYER